MVSLYPGPPAPAPAPAPRLHSQPSCRPICTVDTLCILTTEDITFAGSLMKLPWPSSQPYPWCSPQIIGKTSPRVDPRGSSRTPEVTIVRCHPVPSGGQSYVGRGCCQKLGVLSGNTHHIEIPICKPHVNLLNFSWKRRHCIWRNMCRESGCAVCKLQGSWGS